jgi:DNA repair protein RadC
MNRYKIRLRSFQVVHEPGLDFGAIEGPEDLVPLLRAILRDACDADRESFIVIALNSRGHAIGYKIVSVGTLTASLVAVRDVFTCALAFPAAALIVAHSHPSQDPTPSAEDLALTERLLQAGELLGIPILDHIVLASSGADDSAWRSIGMIGAQRSRAG